MEYTKCQIRLTERQCSIEHKTLEQPETISHDTRSTKLRHSGITRASGSIKTSRSSIMSKRMEAAPRAAKLKAVVPLQLPLMRPISRTTEWQQWRHMQDHMAREEDAVEKASCEEYSSRVCHKTMVGIGHTQSSGKRYCLVSTWPDPKEEWLAL